jgi:diaminohydroxyphosphoribosylaminopyrimidine deaminase/5-amino-6-(5-phosphoribosylamino)uracil reductase
VPTPFFDQHPRLPQRVDSVLAALRLGRAMLGQVWPNPAVGCVIVREGVIVGQGQTQSGGRPHAERVALDDAGALARGATAYVTLEPCCHWGRTPPCTDAMIEAGIRRVVVAIQDPDPRVNGGGLHRFRDAAVEVSLGLGAGAAAATHAGFFHRLNTGRPRLIRARTVPRWADARIGRRGDIPLGVLRQGRTARPVFLQLTHRRDIAATDFETGEADPGVVLGRLGQLGLTNVAVHPDDPLAATLDHPIGGRTPRLIG